MTSRTILSVGQCRPDTAAITQFFTSNFDARVITSDLPADTMETLASVQVDLILINRKLDADYSDGMEILKAIRKESTFADIPVMLISNFPEWQEKAVDAGATYGFGKAELNSPDVVDRVRAVLEL